MNWRQDALLHLPFCGEMICKQLLGLQDIASRVEFDRPPPAITGKQGVDDRAEDIHVVRSMMPVGFRFVEVHFAQLLAEQVHNFADGQFSAVNPVAGDRMANIHRDHCPSLSRPFEDGFRIARRAESKIFQAHRYPQFFAVVNQGGEISDCGCWVDRDVGNQTNMEGYEGLANTLDRFEGSEMEVKRFLGPVRAAVAELKSREIAVMTNAYAFCQIRRQVFFGGCKVAGVRGVFDGESVTDEPVQLCREGMPLGGYRKNDRIGFGCRIGRSENVSRKLMTRRGGGALQGQFFIHVLRLLLDMGSGG